MLLSAICMFGALLTSCIIAGQAKQENSQVSRLIPSNRDKRSFLNTGLKTVQGLLKSADEFSSNKIQRTFRKFGNYQTAIDDFYSLKPTDVRTVKMANGIEAKAGMVGGYKLYIYKGGLKDRATLDIIRAFEIKDALKTGRPRPPVETIHYRF